MKQVKKYTAAWQSDRSAEINMYELMYLIWQKDDDAYQILFEELKPNIDYVYYAYLASELPYSEWQCIAYESFNVLINRYREGSEARISTVFQSFLRRRATDLIRQNNLVTRDSPGQGLSLDALDVKGCRDMMENNAHNPLSLCIEESVLTTVTCDHVLNILKDRLSSEDHRILQMMRSGYSGLDISRILSIPSSRVYSAVARARSRWKEYELSLQQQG